MLDYDILKLAEEHANSVDPRTEVWAEAEGIEIESVTRFCVEQAASMLMSPMAARDALTMVTAALIVGIRYGNLVRNPDLSTLDY